MRKNKGDVSYYMEISGDKYHLVKKIKTRNKALLKDGAKTTKLTVCDIFFSAGDLSPEFFIRDGLRPEDQNIVIQLMIDIEDKSDGNG
ncbi:hypothetical protein [Morganella morganii]|uniref:hypothetical protein n=1 Tax=Morganella morganii TaxID=582 RepID=UPI000469A613|nr:hypothetical protein [Morganella morganii]